jgi:hypothetical protein
LPWSCAIGWPLVNDSGIGLPVISAAWACSRRSPGATARRPCRGG